MFGALETRHPFLSSTWQKASTVCNSGLPSLCNPLWSISRNTSHEMETHPVAACGAAAHRVSKRPTSPMFWRTAAHPPTPYTKLCATRVLPKLAWNCPKQVLGKHGRPSTPSTRTRFSFFELDPEGDDGWPPPAHTLGQPCPKLLQCCELYDAKLLQRCLGSLSV